MSEQYDEHEQSERVKQWLVKNGSNLLTGVLLAVSVVFGWQWWQNHQLKKTQEAGNQYQTFIDAIEKPDPAKAVVLGEAMAVNYGKTDYAFLALLRLAKLQEEQGKPEAALAALNKASTIALTDQNRELAKIRTAQMLISQGKTAEATKMTSAMKAKYYPGSLAEMRGDLALLAGNRSQAVTFYDEALLKLDQDAGSRALIELKLADAGGTPGKAKEIR
jgi:predicted negative regulator of RcsB-dependent stress response